MTTTRTWKRWLGGTFGAAALATTLGWLPYAGTATAQAAAVVPHAKTAVIHPQQIPCPCTLPACQSGC
jgi:hypothetical protein